MLYLFYLSLFHAGQIFMGYQWDVLLLEVGFLAIFLPGRQRLVVWLYRLLLFRFMFLSGAVKLLSNDVSWADLTALSFHFETQPLPTALAGYADPVGCSSSPSPSPSSSSWYCPFLSFCPGACASPPPGASWRCRS